MFLSSFSLVYLFHLLANHQHSDPQKTYLGTKHTTDKAVRSTYCTSQINKKKTQSTGHWGYERTPRGASLSARRTLDQSPSEWWACSLCRHRRRRTEEEEEEDKKEGTVREKRRRVRKGNVGWGVNMQQDTPGWCCWGSEGWNGSHYHTPTTSKCGVNEWGVCALRLWSNSSTKTPWTDCSQWEVTHIVTKHLLQHDKQPRPPHQDKS